MKATLFILSLLLMIQTAVKAQQVDSVHREKAKRIIERLLLNNSLPSAISHYVPPGLLPDTLKWVSFYYYTKRMDMGKWVDSVLVHFTIDSSKSVLEFEELREKPNHGQIELIYSMRKGELIIGLNYSRPQQKSEQFVFDPKRTTKDSRYINYNADPNYDSKAIAFYLPKLYYSIDELYELLNK